MRNDGRTPKKGDRPPARCLAVLGTGSDVGKSIIVTALCRLFSNRGIRTAPFKAQNMSNNSGVTPEGLEMGRAQIVQAEAAGIVPQVDMNPVLLKPTSDVGAQVVVLGKALTNSTASDYHKQKASLAETACRALDRLCTQYDLIVMEGAGSCAEVNLMDHDIVNFQMAHYADAPVILVADIHRGGVFAQVVGTLACLSGPQQDRIGGVIINRFRGDISLFADGVRWIEQKTAKEVYGVLPWYTHITIEAEDSLVLEKPVQPDLEKRARPSIAVIRLPHIANFTDFDPLIKIASLNLVYLEAVQGLDRFCAVILPGSKNTRWDLEWLMEKGWHTQLTQYAAGGGHILGICGGYQMMGNLVCDPDGLEGAPGKTRGLNLLPVETVLKAPKTTTLTVFRWQKSAGTGYEIHMGRTDRQGGEAWFDIIERNGRPDAGDEGCVAYDGRMRGTYLHGLFDVPAIAAKWLETIGLAGVAIDGPGGLAARSRQYDLLAAHFEKYIDVNSILKLADRPKSV
jgi:adenosylcobyric acid synthase